MKSGKFAYYSEIELFARGKDVCVIYHHLNRHETHTAQIESKVGELRKHIKPSGGVFALRYQPYSPRAYFILANSSKKGSMRARIHDFLKSPCGKHWDSYKEG